MFGDIHIKTKKGMRQRYCKTVKLASPCFGGLFIKLLTQNLVQ